MDKPISLKQRLQQANTGDVIVTDQARTGVYVAAKRAGVTVSTTELLDGGIKVTILAQVVQAPQPKISQFDSVLNIVSEWTSETRLKLFEQFELCCGMKRGNCVCVEAETPAIAEEVPLSRQEKLDALREMISAPKATAQVVEESPNEWIDIGEKWNEITGDMVEMQRHYKIPNKFRPKPEEY